MINYDIRCTEGHIDEVAFGGISAFKDFIPMATCAQCDSPVEVVILPRNSPKGIGVIYNAHGFYGSIPTEMAHNTQAV